MQSGKAALAVVAAVVALSGCGRQTHTSEAKQGIEEQLAALRSEVASLALTVADGQMLRDEVTEIHNAVQRMEYRAAAEKFATLQPNSDGYAVIRATLGQITVDIESVTASANGTAVTLKFGNPLHCDLRDVEMTVRYGAINSAGQPVEETAKTKQVNLGKTLRGGMFTKARIGLDDIKPADLGFVSIGNIHHASIALAQ
jgi:multidrug efflux pump subunit AcrA (membrane-fusion protein)